MTQFLALAGFGFLLGMRHATEADHVIAVTTILNRSRRFAHTTLIGLLWGLGHSVTVILVGTAIIVFNVVIPHRSGWRWSSASRSCSSRSASSRFS